MVSVTKKYSNGRFSFVYSESGEEKGECFFSPQTAEILEIKEYSNLSFQERKTLILAVLNHLELSGKEKAVFRANEDNILLNDLGFILDKENTYSVDLRGYFNNPPCLNK
ncbi:MAG: hypothetical protein KHW62_05065 [Clostridiales bacterium]|nr:hypothetical protein [Clostridiales bacterium]